MSTSRIAISYQAQSPNFIYSSHHAHHLNLVHSPKHSFRFVAMILYLYRGYAREDNETEKRQRRERYLESAFEKIGRGEFMDITDYESLKSNEPADGGN